jgi:hypothetical protein
MSSLLNNTPKMDTQPVYNFNHSNNNPPPLMDTMSPVPTTPTNYFPMSPSPSLTSLASPTYLPRSREMSPESLDAVQSNPQWGGAEMEELFIEIAPGRHLGTHEQESTMQNHPYTKTVHPHSKRLASAKKPKIAKRRRVNTSPVDGMLPSGFFLNTSICFNSEDMDATSTKWQRCDNSPPRPPY